MVTSSPISMLGLAVCGLSADVTDKGGVEGGGCAGSGGRIKATDTPIAPIPNTEIGVTIRARNPHPYVVALIIHTRLAASATTPVVHMAEPWWIPQKLGDEARGVTK